MIEDGLVDPGCFRTHYIKRPNLRRFFWRDVPPDPAKEKDWVYIGIRGWLIGEASTTPDECHFFTTSIYLTDSESLLAVVETGLLDVDQI